MSILGQTTAPASSGWSEVAFFAPLALAGLVVAWRIGAFRLGTVSGPLRLRDDGELGMLLITLLFGFLLWITIPTAVVLWMMRDQPSAATRPGALSPQVAAVASTVSGVIATFFLVIANLTIRRGGVSELGLSPGRVRNGLVTGLIGAMIMVPVVFFVATLTQLAWRAIRYEHPREHDLLKMLGESQNTPLSIVLLAAATLVAPIFEEILFRGHLQTMLTYAFARLRQPRPIVRQGGFDVVLPDGQVEPVAPVIEPPPPRPAPSVPTRWLAIVITSLLFAVVHPLWTVPPIFILSLCLGYAYERTANLWTVIVMHALFNATSTTIYLLFAP